MRNECKLKIRNIMKVYVIFVFNMMAVLKTKGKLVQRMAQKFYKKQQIFDKI